MKTHLNTAKILHFQECSKPEVENVMRYEKNPHEQLEYANDLSKFLYLSVLFGLCRIYSPHETDQ